MHIRNLFDQDVMERGRQLLRDGSVSYYIDNQTHCMARVRDDRLYSVTILHPDRDNPVLRCECADAAAGRHCAHMAAVCLRWRDDHPDSARDDYIDEWFPALPEKQQPFFYVRDMLLNDPQPPLVWQRARQLEETEPVENTHWLFGYRQSVWQDSEEYLVCKATGEVRRDRSEPRIVEVLFERGYIAQARCDVCDHYFLGRKNRYGSDSLCPHELLLCREADAYFRRENPGDATSFSANRFLAVFDQRQRQAQGLDEEREPVLRLEPQLLWKAGRNVSDDSVDLRFRISDGGKWYIIQNLSELVERTEQGGSLSFGKSLKVDFRRQTFTADASGWFDLIAREVQKSRILNDRMSGDHSDYRDGTVLLRRTVPLSGQTLDEFFARCEGTRIAMRCSGRQQTRTLHISVGGSLSPQQLLVSPWHDDDMTMTGITVSGETPLLLSGISAHYCLDDHALSCLDEEAWRLRQPFQEAARGKPHFELRIGHRHLQQFYYRVLPMLRRDASFEIIEEQGAAEMIPPEAEFTFYFDSAGGELTCRTEIDYAADSYTLEAPQARTGILEEERDADLEKEVLRLLSGYLPSYRAEDKVFFVPDEDDNAYRLLTEGIPQLQQFGDVEGTDRFDRNRVRRPPAVQLGVSVHSDLLDLEVMTPDLSSEELREVLESYRQKKKYHRLRSGEFVPLEGNESLAVLTGALERLHVPLRDFVAGRMHLPAYRALYLDSLFERHEELAGDRDRSFRSLIKQFRIIDESDFEVPEALRSVLRPYQEYGYKWMRTLAAAGFGGILADDMGLGKTLQMLAVLEAEREQGGSGPALVVCPASLVYNWEEETSRFTPQLRVRVVSGTKAERRRLLAPETAAETDLLITSYNLLKRDLNLYEDWSFAYVVLDEAQYIKNAGSATAKSVKVLQARHRFALTGTPIENRLSELWSIFDFLMPGFLYRYQEFRSTYETPIARSHDEEAAASLHAMISPFLLRRRKEEVLRDLPEKNEEVWYTAFESEQRRLYDAQVVRIRDLLESGEEMQKMRLHLLAELTKLRQICCDPSLLFDDYHGASAKRETCLELLRTAREGDHKVLLFSQFTTMLALLEEDLQREGFEYCKITGATPKKQRLQTVHEFNESDTPVFLISLKAGGTGLNLTGADIVVHYDPWWNAAAQNQATDRAHRIGQTKNVLVYRLIARGTIEEKILAMQEAKTELSDSILGGESRTLASLSREELLELLS